MSPPSSFSTAAFAQLVRRLRHTNARYVQIARQFRCRLRPTHYAKRRAFRAGLCIDTLKACTLSEKYVSVKSPPVVDSPTVTPSWMDQTRLHAPAKNEGHGAHHEDAYMRGPALRNLPDVGQRQRIMLRLPPLKLHPNVDHPRGTPFQGPMPGAPRLLPRQLPEDESGAETTLASAASSSSFVDGSDSLMAPLDAQMYSGLCITIPPRGVKRKLHDVDPDENTAPSQQPKRVLRARWNESERAGP